jgi:hypothetical protein
VELTDEEVACVLPLALGRLAMNVSIWQWRLRQGENVAYATAKSEFTTAVLDDALQWDFANAQQRVADVVKVAST